jgi:2-dehydro-3-deoxyphosphooctonate aldolase (KDO 8-P synthase)
MMKESGCPVIFDATHSVQSMGGEGGASGGSREYILPLAKAAIAVGVDGIFIECHPDPDKAPSDAKSMLKLSDMEEVLSKLVSIKSAS